MRAKEIALASALSSASLACTGNGGPDSDNTPENLFCANWTAQEISTPLESPVALDIDNDGTLDLVGISGDDQAFYMLRNDSSFGPVTLIDIGSPIWSMSHGDFTGDGTDDLLVAHEGTGDGSLAVFPSVHGGPGSAIQSDNIAAFLPVPGDFNGDGHLDIVEVGSYGADHESWLGDGMGHFAFGEAFPDFCEPSDDGLCGPEFAVGTDFNQDGAGDIAVLNFLADNITVYFGDPSTPWETPKVLTPDVGYLDALLTSDINGDGNEDLVVTHEGAVSTYLGTGDGSFLGPSTSRIGASFNTVGLAHVDGDSQVDLVGVGTRPGDGYGKHTLFVSLGAGDGTFASVREMDLEFSSLAPDNMSSPTLLQPDFLAAGPFAPERLELVVLAGNLEQDFLVQVVPCE